MSREQGNEEQSMSIAKVTVDGREYPIAPMEPECHDHPTPMYLMAVTPAVARSWLRYNLINRNQRERGKRNYASDMRGGNFLINGSSVTFSRPYQEGEDPDVPTGWPVVMDGQHRLESCIASNTPFVTYVGYGLAPEVRITIDTGLKRTYSDTLRFRGEKNTTVLGSVIKKAAMWTNGNRHLVGKNGDLTHADLDATLEQFPELRRSTEVAARTDHEFKGSTGHPLRKSVVGVAHWLFMQVDETLAPEFFFRIGDGAEMAKNDPIMQLRRRLVQDLTVPRQERGDTRREIQYVDDWQQMCYYIRAWNARLIWSGLPKQERDAFAFALVGPNDSKKMPEIKTVDQAYDELEKLEAKRKRAQQNSSSD